MQTNLVDIKKYAVKRRRYGFKAYGEIKTFSTKKLLNEFILRWILQTEGSERDRAVKCLKNFTKGIFFTDTDI